MKLFRKLLTSLKERGIRGTIREIIYRLNLRIRVFADRRFDRKYGIDTRGIVRLRSLDININQKKTAYWYEPTPIPALKFMFKMLEIDHSKYIFIDFGSGKGRVLMLASEYPYKKIIGVEVSQSLTSIAKNNFRKWNNRKQKCFNIELICMDARDFKLPNDPLVLFFFTPFQTPIITQVVNNIQESLRDNPRPIQALYYGTNREFIDILCKLNLTCREIYSRRPLSAIKKYKGFIFSQENETFRVKVNHTSLG